MGPRKITMPAEKYAVLLARAGGSTDDLVTFLRVSLGVPDLTYVWDRPDGINHVLIVKSASFDYEACLCKAPEWRVALA